MKTYTVILILLFSLRSLAQSNNFHIRQINYYADVQLQDLINLDSLSGRDLNLNSIPINEGTLTIVFLLRTSANVSKDNFSIEKGKELIVIKVLKDYIIEAYYIPLSWHEPPISNVLLKSNKRVRLKKNIDLSFLEFKPVNTHGINIAQDGKLIFDEILLK